MASVLDILRPSVVTGLMNEIRTPFDRFQEFFGQGPKGANTLPSETRSVSVDLVNDDRTLAQFTAPGADAAIVAPMVIGTKQVTAPRTFERMTIDYERINNIRAIGKGASDLDRAGLVYLKQMAGHMLRRTRRWREFLLWGMMQGSCQFLLSGIDWVPVASGGTVTLDWGVAATHKNQINSNIPVSWDNVAANIITDIGNINAFSEAECGIPLMHAWCCTSTWTTILNNSQVRNLGGSAQEPFEMWQAMMQAMPNYGGEGTNIPGQRIEHTGVLRGYPSMVFHITDRGITLNGTFTRFFQDGQIFFHPDPDQEWTFGYEVKESTNQTYGTAPVDVYGFGSWLKYPVDADVPKYLLYSVDNFFPVVNPLAVFFAQSTF